MRYIIGIDQSTQGTKAILFDGEGQLLKRVDIPHRQLVNEQGFLSHDPLEIYRNTVQAVRNVVEQADVSPKEIAAIGISNQRETTVLWDEPGNPLADAVVWQCSRASYIAEGLKDRAQQIREKTGLPLSAYFPAAKMAWLMEHAVRGTDHMAGEGNPVQGKMLQGLHFGTIDSWLLYKLTGGKSFQTDYSNASRTQLFNLHTLKWDEELCEWFGIPMQTLPEVHDSNSCFGTTDLEGFFPQQVPVLSMMGDSHAALFGQGCHRKGMVKTTYGTGSSIMMNVGETCVQSSHGLASSLAWGIDGKVTYVLEGNINYTGAVITWLKDDMKLIQTPAETQELALSASPADETVLVPAFTGLSAPYWKENARALLCGMSRTTNRAQIVRAALDSIAFQITDVLKAMEQDFGEPIRQLRVDGGPARNEYLMQFQSDMADRKVCVAGQEELSAIGTAYLAGITAGIYDREKIFTGMKYREFTPGMSKEERERRYGCWKRAVEMV